MPRWPEGVVGSISHTRGAAVVAVAPASALRSVGVDVELDVPLREELRHIVCTDYEQGWLGALSDDDAGWQGKALFSAKEALYKAQFPLTHTFLGFAAVDIDLDLDAKSFSATFRIDAGAIAAGTRWRGTFAREAGLIATAIHVTP